MNYDKERMREYMRGRRKVKSVALPTRLEGKVVGCANCVRLEAEVVELKKSILGLEGLVVSYKVYPDKLSGIVERKGISLCEHGSAKGVCKHGCK